MYGAKLRLFFDNTKLFGLYFAFPCKLFQYILHLIRQIFHSSVLNLLRNTEAGFGDGADDARAGQDVRRGGRQDDAAEHGHLAGAQVARGADIDAVDLAHAGDGIHQHGEEGTDADQEEGGRVAQAVGAAQHGLGGCVQGGFVGIAQAFRVAQLQHKGHGFVVALPVAHVAGAVGALAQQVCCQCLAWGKALAGVGCARCGAHGDAAAWLVDEVNGGNGGHCWDAMGEDKGVCAAGWALGVGWHTRVCASAQW